MKISLMSEEKRRRTTVALLSAGMLLTGLPIINQRALFSPLGDVPILGDVPPAAYGALVATSRGPGGPGVRGGRSGVTRTARADDPRSPVAFAARVPFSDTSGGEADPASADPALGGGSSSGAGFAGAGGSGASGANPIGGGGLGNSPLPGGGVDSGTPGGIEPGAGGGSDPGAGGGVDPGAGGGINPGDIGGILPGPTGAVPEPATWLTMILGFGVIGWAMRRGACPKPRRLAQAEPIAVDCHGL